LKRILEMERVEEEEEVEVEGEVEEEKVEIRLLNVSFEGVRTAAESETGNRKENSLMMKRTNAANEMRKKSMES